MIETTPATARFLNRIASEAAEEVAAVRRLPRAYQAIIARNVFVGLEVLRLAHEWWEVTGQPMPMTLVLAEMGVVNDDLVYNPERRVIVEGATKAMVEGRWLHLWEEDGTEGLPAGTYIRPWTLDGDGFVPSSCYFRLDNWYREYDGCGSLWDDDPEGEAA